jgi:hypothetical protein
MKSTGALHSSASNEHYTPVEYIEAARHVMGGIDLDPASTQSVNELRIKATNFHSKEENGLVREWHGRVWLNPPGGRIGNRSSAAVWWDKLVDEYLSGRVTQALFLGFSIEILATTQGAVLWPGEVPFCCPRRRIEFLQSDGDGGFSRGESPTHSNIIAFLPPLEGGKESLARFEEHFGPFGKVRT